MNNELYKRGFSLPYLKCLSLEEAVYVLQEIHEGICGNHLGPWSLVGKAIQASYFWPTMQKDAIELIQRCDKCQSSISSPWPFLTWGIDIVGPLPQGKQQVKFLLVVIDYFTKWVEEKSLVVITENKIQYFIWKYIVCRFGIPRVIIFVRF